MRSFQPTKIAAQRFKDPKAKYRFALNGADVMAIAGIWRAGGGDQLDSVCHADDGTERGRGADPQSPFVVLPLEKWRAWLPARAGVVATVAGWIAQRERGAAWP